MVFHDIESVREIISGHRVILYFIECESCLAESKINKSVEAALGCLLKKNDDLLIVKVINNSDQFNKFQELYKADIQGQVTLFAVNDQGIPITSQHIHEVKDISPVIVSLCNTCQLNSIPVVDSANNKSNSASFVAIDSITKTEIDSSLIKSIKTISQTELNAEEVCRPNQHSDNQALGFSLENKSIPTEADFLPSSTQLQIRLPDGNRHKQNFDKEALLNEVRVFINTQYKLKDFDLKTYNHQNFSEDEYNRTLKDLDLYPNGVVIVVSKHSTSSNGGGWIGPIVRYNFYQLLSKTTSVFNYVQGLFVLFWSRLFFSNSRPAGNNQGSNQVTPAQTTSNQSNTSQRRSKSSTTSFGNIHTLRRNDDSDDENNRYNGNSTQQK